MALHKTDADRIHALLDMTANKQNFTTVKLRNEIIYLMEALNDHDHMLGQWFDQKRRDRDALGAMMLDAAKGYLRISRVGGMDPDLSDEVAACVENMIHHGTFTQCVTEYIMQEIARDRTDSRAADQARTPRLVEGGDAPPTAQV